MKRMLDMSAVAKDGVSTIWRNVNGTENIPLQR
jgi:hypothetical protein